MGVIPNPHTTSKGTSPEEFGVQLSLGLIPVGERPLWFTKIEALAWMGLIPWVVFYPSNVQTWSLCRWEKCYRPCNADSLRFLIFPRIYYFWHIRLWLHFHNHLELISCLVLTNNSSSLVVIHFPFEFCILADWIISFNKFSIFFIFVLKIYM